MFAFFYNPYQLQSQELSYINYSTHNGLPSNQIYHFHQDKNGYMWFATDRGISRFDGYEFKNFDLDDGITSSTVFRFFPQKNGDVWCATYSNEWFRFNEENYQFEPHPHNDSIVKYSMDELYEDFVIDQQGTMYFSYSTMRGALGIDSSGSVVSKPSKYKKDGAELKLIQEVLPNGENLFYKEYFDENRSLNLHSKRVLLTDDKGKNVVNGYSKAVEVDNSFVYTSGHYGFILNDSSRVVKKLKFKNRAIGLGRYDENHFWVGFTKGGVRIYSLEGEEKHHFLKDKSVSFCYRDNYNGLWFSTISSGVYYAQSDNVLSYSFKWNLVKRISKAKDSDLYVSTLYGELYKGNVSGFEKVYSDKISFGNAFGFYDSSMDCDIVICRRSLMMNGETYPVPFYVSYISDSKNKAPFLIGGYNCIYYSPKRSFERIENRVNSLEWADNGIYVGTSKGMYFYDTLNREMSQLSYPELNVRVEDITRTKDWYFIGTMGKGLFALKEGQIKRISKKDGLSSNLITRIKIENDSVVWVATNTGLNRIRFKGEEYQIEQFDTSDGLIDNDISGVEIIGDRLWVGTRSGLCTLLKSSLNKKKTPNFHLKWKQYKANNQTISKEELQDLKASQNELSFSYQSVWFANTDRLKYRYRLGGEEKEWNYTNERKFNYPAISPGEYQLIVQASIDDKNWEKNELRQTFYIHPPFYNRAWFKVLALLSVSGIVYLFFRFKVLVYNEETVREILRHFLKRVKKETPYFTIKEQGKDIKVNSEEVLFIKSAGNYLEIHTQEKTYLIRYKLSEFTDLVPDRLEYLRINRSYIVRIDKIKAKDTKNIFVSDIEIPIGKTYKTSVAKLEF